MTFVDGVAALGAESVDLTASGVAAYVASPQKAIAGPAGLALTVLNKEATSLLSSRQWRPAGYGLDLARWLPVMQATEHGQFEYFQTPAGNLLSALNAALREILGEGAEARTRRHYTLRDRLHAGLSGLGMTPVVTEEGARSNGITVCRTPGGRWTPAQFVDAVAAAGVQIQTGTHPLLARETFRIGHLGNVSAADIDRTLEAIHNVVLR
jgi:alanine-glyoxylate transaminase/serine-glyoxylate transaminase/serine-pyruvate transaminase